MSVPTFQRYQAEFCAHARSPRVRPRPAGVAAKRIGVYAQLLFNNMEGTLAGCFPVCKSVLGTRRWCALVRQFLVEHRCTTPLFRQIPEEFLQWLSQAGGPGLLPFLLQLAHYEWVELALALADVAPPEGCDPDGDLLQGTPVVAPASRLLRYDWPVQRISPRFRPKQALTDPVWLLVLRDTDDVMQFIELNPVSARLIELLQTGVCTGRAALLRIAQELAHPDSARVVAFGADVLASLKRHGAILGTVPCK